MTVKVDKTTVQMKIRSEAGIILDQLLGEELYRHCFISGDDAWTFSYTYVPTAVFPDEIIFSGYVLAKAKKKYSSLIPKFKHRFAFCVRVRGKYDMDVVLNQTDEVEL